MFSNHHPLKIIVDSGTTDNMVRLATTKRIGARITDTSQSAMQADGSTLLSVVGETRFTLKRSGTTCHFEGLLIEDLNTEILSGALFMERNDLSVRPAISEIWIGNNRIKYGSTTSPPNVKRVRSTHVLSDPHQQTIVWPDEYLELFISDGDDDEFAIEPL